MELPQTVLASLPEDSLLCGLDTEERARLLARAVRLVKRPGEMLMEQGAAGDSLMILLSGTAKVSRVLENGREVVLELMRPGAVIGELSVFDEEPRAASVTAMEPCTVLAIRRGEFLAHLRERPDVALGILRMVSRRLRRANLRVEESGLGVAVRLARGLLRLAEDHGEGETARRLPFKLNQTTLAGYVSLSREKVNRQLKMWAAEGLIALARGQVTILDPEALEDLAQALE